MKLFYCSECDLYSIGAYVTMELYAELDASTGKLWATDVDLPSDGFTLIDVVRGECPECEGQTQLVEVEQCPHSWRKLYNKTERECIFCKKREKGNVVWS